MVQSRLKPPPRPHMPLAGQPLVWPMDEDGYGKLEDVRSQLRLLIDALCVKSPLGDSQVHLDQGGLICFLGKMMDLVKGVIDSCETARENKK